MDPAATPAAAAPPERRGLALWKRGIAAHRALRAIVRMQASVRLRSKVLHVMRTHAPGTRDVKQASAAPPMPDPSLLRCRGQAARAALPRPGAGGAAAALPGALGPLPAPGGVPAEGHRQGGLPGGGARWAGGSAQRHADQAVLAPGLGCCCRADICRGASALSGAAEAHSLGAAPPPPSLSPCSLSSCKASRATPTTLCCPATAPCTCWSRAARRWRGSTSWAGGARPGLLLQPQADPHTPLHLAYLRSRQLPAAPAGG
jgi:hypothetical protein